MDQYALSHLLVMFEVFEIERIVEKCIEVGVVIGVCVGLITEGSGPEECRAQTVFVPWSKKSPFSIPPFLLSTCMVNR